MGEESDWAEDTIGIRTPDNRTSYQVNNLEPFTVYSFRIIAVTSNGLMSIPSKESYYMVTLREIPDGRPVITSSGNVSSTSISLTWNPPPKHTIHGEFLGYKIKYRPTSDNNLKLIPTPEVDMEEKDVILRDPDLRVSLLSLLSMHSASICYYFFLSSLSLLIFSSLGSQKFVSWIKREKSFKEFFSFWSLSLSFWFLSLLLVPLSFPLFNHSSQALHISSNWGFILCPQFLLPLILPVASFLLILSFMILSSSWFFLSWFFLPLDPFFSLSLLALLFLSFSLSSFLFDSFPCHVSIIHNSSSSLSSSSFLLSFRN